MCRSFTEVWNVLIFTWIALVWILETIEVLLGSRQYVRSLDQVLSDSFANMPAFETLTMELLFPAH